MTTPTRRLLTALLLVTAAQAGVRTQEPTAASRPARVAPPSRFAPSTPLAPEDQRQLVRQYCVGCHSDAARAGGLSLAGFNPSHVAENGAVTEKMIRKLRAGMMPPSAAPRRPDAGTMNAFVTTLESAVDASAAKHPNAGHRSFQRLNRAEYARSIHDLLALDVDVEAFLPSDTISSGFDNIADVQSLSPTLMEGYLRAASSVARLAVGDPKVAPSPTTYHVSRTEGQMRHVEGAPIGTRGGLSIVHTFPADGDYVFKLTFFDGGTGELFGGTTITSTDVGEQAEISVDGARVGVFTLNGWMDESDPQGLSVSTPPMHLQAGPHRVSAAFIQRYAGPNDDLVAPLEITDANPRIGIVYGVTALPHVRDLTIAGPTRVTGISDTPSRRKIFSCRPATGREDPCAFEIIRRLATEAFREPVGAAEFEILRGLYSHEREKNGFDAGIRLALQGILASPRFLFRFEGPSAATARDGQTARLSNFALASRLSFFLWGSAPDAALLAAATQGRLDKPAVLEQQVRRMLADSRRDALATRFASLWLRLQDVEKVNPVALHYPDYDHYLSESFVRETELFFDNIVKEDRSVLDLLTADYSFVNERIARLYGIPNVIGSEFRRVPLPPERRGLLGQGSVLMQTSVADRTSPVQRGKWIMEVLLGSPPPPPPPNVPAFEETRETGNGRILTVRERMEQHRANPVCASCHRVIDPPGLALENFDVTGKWRIKDQGTLIDAAGQLYDGTKMDGPAGLRDALLKHADLVLLSFTENLMTYALGRRVEYYDMPRVRAIVREAGAKDNRLSAFILGIVKSPAFQMQSAPAPASAVAAISGESLISQRVEKVGPMYLTKKHLPRRTVLKGMGVTLALPLLDAMVPAATAQQKTAAAAKVRLSCIEVVHGSAGSTPLGAKKNLWAPAEVGRDFDLTPSCMSPLEPWRDWITIVSNTDVPNAEAQGPSEVGADHYRSACVFLTQAHPKQTMGADVRLGVSLDQLYAQRFGQDTPIPSMQLCIENVDQAGGCGYGYACVYTDSLSWASATEPLPMVRDPRVAFDQLFGAGATKEERAMRRVEDRSVLDAVTAMAGTLANSLGASDRARFTSYLENVREIERRIQRVEAYNRSGEPRELLEAPMGVPDSFDGHVKLMFDLQALAFAADITRVFSFKFARDSSSRTYPESGTTAGFHNASHHGEKEEGILDYAKINKYHVSLIPYFLEKLKNTPDGDSNLLENTVLMYGSPMGDSNVHNHKRVPLFLAGHMGGKLKGGRHLKAADGTSMANAHLSLLHGLGLTGLESFGDSTGTFDLNG